MSPDTWSIVIGLVPTVIGLWLTWHLRYSAPQISADVRTTRLRMNRPIDDLSISWRGGSVSEPVLVEVMVWNSGRTDILLAAFEGGHVVVKVPGTKYLDLTSEGATRGFDVHPGDDGVKFELPAQLIKRREGARAVAICDGTPGLAHYDLRLSNVEVGRSSSSVLWRRALARAFAMTLILDGLVIGTLLASTDGAAADAVGPVALFVTFMLALTVIGTFLGAMGIRVAESVADENLAVQKIDFGSPRP